MVNDVKPTSQCQERPVDRGIDNRVGAGLHRGRSIVRARTGLTPVSLPIGGGVEALCRGAVSRRCVEALRRGAVSRRCVEALRRGDAGIDQSTAARTVARVAAHLLHVLPDLRVRQRQTPPLVPRPSARVTMYQSRQLSWPAW
jgi:hypothetical protein